MVTREQAAAVIRDQMFQNIALHMPVYHAPKNIGVGRPAEFLEVGLKKPDCFNFTVNLQTEVEVGGQKFVGTIAEVSEKVAELAGF